MEKAGTVYCNSRWGGKKRETPNSGDIFFKTIWHTHVLEQRHESWQQTVFCFKDMPFAVFVKIHTNLAKLSSF